MRATVLILCALSGGCKSEDPNAPLTGPERLSDTGLYADFSTRRITDGLFQLEPRYPYWSDGADKTRYLLLPKGSRIDTRNMDDWRFPVGTKVWKEFRLDGRLIETRLLEKRREPDDGGWFQMAYVWREDGSEAIATPAGLKNVRGGGYEVPRQKDCINCHYRGEKPIIGISAMQLSTRADGGPGPIESLIAAGALSDNPTQTYAPPGEGVVQAALGYLHGNCSHCHNSHSAVAADVKVFMNIEVADARPEDTQAYRSLVGQAIHHFPDVGLGGLVVPGEPGASLVIYRMARRDDLQMPPLLTHQVDEVGLGTISSWISGLPSP